MNNMNARLTEAFRRFMIIYRMSIQDRPGCPPTRDELGPAGIDKKSLQKLTSMGILKDDYMPIQVLSSESIRTKPVYRVTSLGWEAAKALKF